MGEFLKVQWVRGDINPHDLIDEIPMVLIVGIYSTAKLATSCVIGL